MLENKKNVRKIRKLLIVLITIIMILGVYIKIRFYSKEISEIETIAVDDLEHVKAEATTGTIGLDHAELNPIYRPKWEKLSSAYDATSKTLTVTVKGAAYKSQTIDSNVTIDYASDVTSTIEAGDITVFVNGVEVTSAVNPTVTVNAGATSTNETTEKTEITHTITLSNLEEAARRANLPYKELSGNIAIKIAGRGKDESTYTENVLTDEYGNQNMMETDQNGTNADGTWINITFEDPETDRNTDNTMFADFIKPEFTYEASNTIIGDGNHGNTKKVTVVFDVTDKYFSNTDLETDTNADLITVKVDNDIVNGTVNVTKTLTKKNDIIINTQTNEVTYQATGYTLGENERKIGERYELLVEGLEQLNENGISNGYTYSGPMSIAFPSGKVTDLSGNVNDATTITIGVDDTDGNPQDTQDPNGEIVDVVDPVWELGDVDLEAGTIKLIAKDKYFDAVNSNVTVDDITVYVNNSESTAITKTITGPVEKVTGQKYEYTLQLSNITPSEAGYTDFTPTNLSELNNTAGFKYKSENGGDISIRIATGPIKDQSGNTSREQMFEIGKIDATKPEVYDVQKIQAAASNTETFVFNVTDRNYAPSKLITTDEITVWVDGEQVDSIQKTSLTNKPIKLDIDGETGKILGHQYTLVLSSIAETLKQEGKSYLEWSGTVEIRIAENAAKDLNENTLNPDTTTISDFVDYIKPVIEPVTVTNPKNTTNKTYTMSFNVIDKYLDTTNMVTENEIKVYIDGELDGDTNKNGVLDAGETPSISKNLTSTEIKETFKKTVDGVVEATATEHVIGHTYTLVLSDFEQALKQSGKDFMEWSGTVKIEIDENAVKDTSNNTLATEVAKRTVDGEHVDFIKPVIEKVSSTIDSNAKTETIIFNVMDKYLDTSDVLTASEISVYVDEELDGDTNKNGVIDAEETPSITKTLTKVQDFTATVNGNTTHLVGQQYKLVLSGFEQASRNAKDYKDWSGTVKIEIAENAVKDTSNNNLAPEVAKRTVAGDFVDFIKPDLEYIHQDTDINHGNKTYTMTFDVTDKYYTSGQFTAQDIIDGNIEILMQNGQKDSNGNAIVYNLKNEPVKITLTPVAKYAPAGTKVTNTSGEIVTTTENSHQIGHTYTLKIENLEKLEIKEGLTTADYSGVITVGIPADRIEDRTIDESSNKNIATTITSGVDIPGGTLPDDAVAVDVVDPIWTKVSASASAIDPANKTSSIATITFKGTDTYFKESTLTINDIQVVVNGSVVSTGITKTLDSTTTLTEERIKNNGLTSAEVETVQYGIQYTVTIKGFAQDANQVKIRIPKGLMVDEHGNDSEETDLIVYNVLKSAASETEATSAFLGEAVATTIYPEGATEVTPIERQNIEKVVFVNSTAGSKASGVQRVWDVSAQGDGSIIAWTSNTTAPYTVYIGSNDEIFANQDSSYLFSYIGYADTCTAEEVITNIASLNVTGVTKMQKMFYSCGYTAMTSLDLGAEFDTSNVTDMNNMFFDCGRISMTSLNLGAKFDTSNVILMNGMFNGCGFKEMTTLTLGNKFNTSKVTNMAYMFANCGYTDMTTLNLGGNFDTAEVENMRYMFYNTGYKAMTSLSLGDKFDTSSVKNMYRMFNGCGYTAMTSLDLGDKFDTSSVTDMNKMFDSCGYTAMTSLDLGDLFYTTNVTDMYKMFNGCGATAMTSLDLGPAFTKIASGQITKQASDYGDWELDKALDYNAYDDFMTNCGKSGAVIYAPEAIYKNITSFKTSSTDTTTSSRTIATSTGRTINPIYRPEWTKVSSALKPNETTPTSLEVTVKGSAYKTKTVQVDGVDTTETIYASDVTSTLEAGDIAVYINGVDVTAETKPTVAVDSGTTATNATSEKTEVTHVITLSNFEEATRRAEIPFKEWSGNIKIRIGGRGEDTSTYYDSANAILKDQYGNQSMMTTDEVDGTWIDVTYSDQDTNHNTANTMFADFIKPEFTYLSSETTIDYDNKILTVVFSAVDQYFDATNSSLALSDFYRPGIDASSDGKAVFQVDGEAIDINVTGNTLTSEAVYDADGTTRIGTKYTLVVKNLQKAQGNDNDAFSYSGIVSIGIPADKFQDLSGNKNDGTTITISVDETDGNPNTGVDSNGAIVDVVDPAWKLENIDIDFENDGVTFDLIATDKYYASNTLTQGMVDNKVPNDKMLIYIDGVLDGDTNGNGILDAGETPTIVKTLTATTNLEQAGTGVKYTIRLSNWNADEYTGSTKIVIPADTITDQYGNTSVEQEFFIGHIDFIKPVIEKVSSTKDANAKNETIIFNVMDKYLDTNNPLLESEIKVYVDNEEVAVDYTDSSTTGLDGQLQQIATFVMNKTTKEVTTQSADYTITALEQVVGQQYKLVLSNFEQPKTSIDRSREFTDWSGTVEVEVIEGAVKDIEVTNPNGEVAGGNTNEATILTGNFVDFIKPNVTYEFAEADIVRNHANKAERKYTMVIDITDKYFENSTFETALNTATTDAEKLAILQQYLTIKVDGVDVTNVDTVTKKIVGIDDVTATMNKTVDGVITTGGTYTIGKRFTLEISDLEQDMVAIDENYLNYSGVITVAIKEDTATDTTGNGNVGTTITSGVNMAGNVEFEADGTPVIVDLVDPLWEVSGTVTARPFEQTATIPIKGTDKYIATNNLQASDITIIVTSPSGVVTVNGANVASEGMTLNITEAAITYGKQYTIKLDGYTSDAYQVKITIRDGVLVDESGNTSQETSFVLFSSLIETSTETNVDSGFLGNTNIERQKIEQVIFQDSLNGINATRWDVSQLQDESIWAWYEATDHGTYKVYIGSYIIINGNVNSSYLFANIGRDSNCAVTGDTTDNEMIENIQFLHVDGVQNMSHMFDGCGYTNMQALDLGEYFDTSSAIDMSYMFQNCGYTAMTSLDLGTKLDTSNVTNMSNMFNGCGQNEMTTFAMGATTSTVDFDTAKVTDMSGMFQNFGHKLGSLTLGENFKTDAVTDMSNMFNGCGKTIMTTIDLGANFNTSKVTNMSGMFQDFATNSTTMTSLDLGNLFYTTSATDMSNMFNGCGATAMTTLDLGPVFTRIADTNTGFITNCGPSSTTIYAPEAIYSSMKSFKLNTTSSTTISLDATTQGTINPVYRPEWTKVSSALNKTTGEMTVVVNGAANKVGAPISQIDYTYDVISTLTANDITVYIDGELASDIDVAISAITEITNVTTGKKEAQYTITLSNFEEAERNGKNFKEWSGNISLQFAKGTLKDMCGSQFDSDGNLVNIEGNSNLSVIDIDTVGTMENIVVEEASRQAANTTTGDANMFADLIKPEFTYEASNTTIDYAKDKKTVTVIFDVTDKYFSSTDLASDANGELITVLVDGELPGDDDGSGVIDGEETLAISKALSKTAILVMNKETKAITSQATDYTVSPTEQKVGERYELVISGLEQNPNNSFDYSGIVTLGFDSGITRDLSGNENDGTTITIGVDDTDGNTQDTQAPNGVVVDVVDPIWRVQNLSTTTTDGITTATMDLIATDKFFQQSTLQKDDIQVKVAGVNIATTAPELQRTLSAPTYIKWDNTTGTYVETTQAEANGVKYTFTASHFEETYEAFFAERAKYAVDPATGRLYREYSGPIEIVIPEGKAIDQSGNTNREFTIDGIGHVDTLRPEVIKVSSTANINATNVELSTHTVVFDIVDKYLDTSAITMTDTSKIHVYLDGELTEVDTDGDGIAEDTVTKTITNIEPLRTTVGTDENHLVGYRYTLELSNFENPRTGINYDREYTDWSGDLTIKIDANVAYDVNPTNPADRRGNAETILAENEENTSNLEDADFVDYIKPDATYQYADTDVSEDAENGKTFTMTFDITDKFYEEDLSIADLQILISAEDETGEGEDGYDDLTNNLKVGKSLRVVQNIENVVNGETKVIGKRYTLVLTNLEQVQKIEGDHYLDYSGAITLIIPKDKVKDSSGNGNDATSITSGINIPGGAITDIEAIDVVAPIWERTSFTTDIHGKTATINLLGTDKYFFDFEKDGDLESTSDDGYGTLTSNEIKLFVNGIETTGSITISGENRLYEERLVLPEYGDGDVDAGATTENVQYGVEYTITITDFPIDANQVKLQLTEGSLIDKSNNKSRTTEFLVYNTLISAATETEATSLFLGEIAPEEGTTISRQDIEKVVFVNNIEGSTASGVQNVWDVSAQRDSSILAWYSETEAPYTVYIGSNDDIYGNVDSSYLFSYIGYSTNCTDTDVVEGLNLLHTENVTNMSYMFNNFGYRKLATFNLGAFDTSKVTNMQGMFNNCGNVAMTSLNLGTKFDTSKVTNMSGMFQGFAQNSSTMTTLDLGATGVTFDTSKVTDMSNMFNSCGQTALTTFSLGSNFDTTAVNNMSGMFQDFAYNLQTLTLGTNFNTSEVTDMSNMFNGCGKTAMTTLTLGDNFNTSKVQNMSGMFQDFATNSSTMTTLDLGEKFYTTSATNMTNMFNGCGLAGMTSLDLGPAFTKIPDVNTDFVTNCGKSGAVIKAPESIYNDMKHFKLNTASSTTIQYTQGTINPIYKPEWTKVSSTLTVAEADNLDASTITIEVNGKVDSTVYANAIQTITSAITAGNDASNLITVKVDGEDAESITQTVEVITNTENEVQYKITLSNFKESVRQIAKNKNFLEWAGNIAIQFAKGTLVDAYGNKNMILIDDIDGNWYDVEIKDATQAGTTDATGNWINTVDNNADAIANEAMFTDFIKPEFTYEFANTVIGNGPTGDKKVIVIFDVTDKYFESTQLSADSLASLITVKVDDDSTANTAITKTLTKLQDLTYTVNGDATHKVGERYQLLIEGLESENGVGYSGPMTLAFPADIVEDKSGNKNIATTITIGIDEPENPDHPDHDEEAIVDVVNPLWTGPHNVNTINRTNDTVNITILGSDKYYDSNTLSEDKITVYVDDAEEASITKALTEITDSTELQTLATNAGLTDVKVGYVLTLSTFGNISGTTKVVIDAGTITDTSGNVNLPTTIFAGNINWEEANEPLQEGYPRYPAFRQDIVDFIDPVIKYQYSAVENAENPDIDYMAKTVTVKFTVTDKYFLESTIINSDGTLNTNVVKIYIDVDGTYTDVTDQLTKNITEANITDGKEYTLVVSNLERNSYYDAIDFSGPMQLVFAADAIDDTSGNKNVATTITLDTDDGDNPNDGVIVDVVDPIIKITTDTAPLSYINSSNTINRDKVNETGTVKVRILAEDKYLALGTSQFISASNTIEVKVQKPNGAVIDDATKLADPNAVTVSVEQKSTTSTQVEYEITLGNFTTNEGIVSIIIPEDMIKDTSGNGNKETEVFVGRTNWQEEGYAVGAYPAFNNSIVDFTMPTWNYATSSITRNRAGETGTVTLKVLGYDIYKQDAPTASELESLIEVYVNNVKHNDIQVAVQQITDTTELETLATQTGLDYSGRTITDVVVGYTVTLSNFGTNDGIVKISIPADTMKDTSGNGNKVTDILVGNPNWIEADVEIDTDNPVYTGFRDSIVDFIKPVIKYQYEENVNPILDREHETVQITFTSTDTNYLSLTDLATNKIELEDIKIYIDNMQVYGQGANEATKITAGLAYEVIGDGLANGIKYTLTLSALELNTLLENEIFERHSGVIKLVIAGDQVADTSGNKNIETTIIVDNDNGDDEANGIIVDFVNPIIYYQDKYINWEKNYALVALRVTDRFYDETISTLNPSDITLYEENTDGQYVQINDFDGKIQIVPIANAYGYDFIIKLSDFTEEFKMKISIPAGKIGDTSGNYNDATEIIVTLDNKKPTWNYVSTDTTEFENNGVLSFTVKGVDKFLNITNSSLDVADLKVIKDGEIYLDGADATDATKITVNYDGMNATEKSKTYTIDITGLTEVGTYSLVFAKDTLVDEFGNKSAATTISFSKSAIAENTGNYTNITYHVTPDMENVHHSYVHELMSVNTTGTNFENTTYRPSTLGELFNNGENPLFAEPMYVPSVDGYTVSKVYAPKSFAGWAEADSAGNIIEDGTVYGLYDEIPNTVTNLKAVWQDATVVFVSSNGNNSNDGQLPTTPVKDLKTAYSKLNASGTAENNIIVIMDAIEWNSSDTLTGNATITSLYAGADYRKDNNAELKISSNMTVAGDITFDNIELYASSTDNKLISNYSGDITLGRGITTPSDKYTIGAVVGGNFDTEASTGELGTHTVRVEAGKYENIIAGSSLTNGEATTSTKSITHNVVIGNMRDAAVSRNDKLTITGYVAIGENEKSCYPTGVTNTTNAVTENYANVTLYSGTFTSTDTAIYLRSINGQTDGLMNFEMFGGAVTGNIYGGSRISTSSEATVFNTMNFYGGQVTGNIFGQGLNDTFTGSSEITLQGNFSITGNVFGGSNRTATTTTSVGKGNSTITVNSSSVTVNGNIYGGGNVTEASTGYITGTTTITLNSGTVQNIYGSGYNCGNTGETNITIENGTVNGKIFGGAYQNQARRTSNITVLGGTIDGNIYGGNDNIASQLDGDAFFQDVNIVIGDTDAAKAPTINGIIYGGGKYDKVDVATIQLIECANITSVFGGSEGSGLTITSDIYLNGMTVNEIYGGSNGADDTTATVSISNIHLQSGTVTDVYGGGFIANSTQANVILDGTATVTSIYGGPNTSGKVTTSNVTLKSGTVTNVFGGGNSAEVGTANVTLDGITINTIYGGSKDAGLTDTSNVTLVSGTVTNVFGGGFNVGATTANIKQQGATVTNIYGGSNGGDTGTTNIDILNSTVANVYGGNYLNGTTRYANINIHGTSTITGKLYGGGYKSAIGKAGETGTATINIAGGVINGDINGGSEQGIVYGNTNINVGFDAIGNASLTPGPINIIGTIYGAGSTLTSGEVTVVGDTNITMDNGVTYPITYFTADGKEKSIYGSGNGGGIYSNGTGTDRSTIHLKDFGTSDNVYLFKSIEDTGNLYIGNSVIELVGALDKPVTATEVGHYYTLNTITNALTIYNNTTLYTQRGFNKVGGFYSYVNQKSTKATVTITDGVATTNVDNKLYTLEGVNLIFAKREVTLANKATLARADWGEVTGMAYFATYKNTSTGKKYDLNLFKSGTYVEGQYNSYHDINTDGFYTTKEDGAQIIDTTNYTNYCDWIINAPTINYDVDLAASTYGQHSVAELLLDYKYASDYTYAPETVYTVNQVSANSLKPGIKLVDPTVSSQLPTVSTNANNTFGLTMETTKSGWKQQASTTIYTASNGSFDGDTVYTSDGQSLPGAIKFKVYNSLNITEEKDLGIVTIKLTGQQPVNETGTESYTFNVVIAVNLQTIVDELKDQYTPSFTDRTETELSYTTDSRVDLSYILFNTKETTPYVSGDYRVISTTIPLPAKTKLTMKDYGQGDSLNKVYYYQVATDTDYYATETVNGATRYLYKLTKFAEMGSTNDLYVDSITTYYHSTEKYVLEKYDISIDFINANVATKVSSDILDKAQETYLELRNSSGTVKYDNGDTTIKYNLVTGQNAVADATISNEESSYSVVESLEIPISIDASILQQPGVLDTKYYDQIAGIAIQIVGENNIRIKAPELQNFKITDKNTGEVYNADSNGVIRIPTIEGLGSMSGDYTLSITQANVSPGLYRAQVILYTADDGKYYGTEAELEPLEFDITFISRLSGLLGVKAEDESSRIINKTTGLNLVEGSVTSNAIDLTVGINNPTDETNIRVELYKRDATYTDLEDETTYTGTSYTLVDIKDYLQGTWTEAVEGSKEYIISSKKTYSTPVELETFEFERAIIQGISSGEYKLVFKAYSDDTLVQTFSKTFIVTQ